MLLLAASAMVYHTDSLIFGSNGRGRTQSLFSSSSLAKDVIAHVMAKFIASLMSLAPTSSVPLTKCGNAKALWSWFGKPDLHGPTNAVRASSEISSVVIGKRIEFSAIIFTISAVTGLGPDTLMNVSTHFSTPASEPIFRVLFVILRIISFSSFSPECPSQIEL